MAAALLPALALVALAAALLAIPVRLQFRLSTEDTPVSTLRVGWLFGLVDRDLALPRKRDAKPRKRGGPGPRELLRLWQSDLRPQIETLVARVWRRIDVAELQVRARLGLGDPAETGRALGTLSPLLAWAAALPALEVDIEPCFDRAELSGHVRGAVRVVPLALLPPLVAFGCSPVTLRELRARPWQKS